MLTLGSLPHAVVGAPMAGGPSTPALAAAVSNAGGLGFLAAGYKSAEALAGEITATRALTGRPFGVNLFVPDAANTGGSGTSRQVAAALAYREQLARDYPPELLPLPDPEDDDGWDAKLELVLRLQVPVVSFTFGLPGGDVITALREAGTAVAVTVTTAREAELAVAAGARMLCLQGPAAGGHRGTFDAAAEPSAQSLDELVRAVRDAVNDDVELIAAGGISTPAQVRTLRAAGADAVQVGTALLLSPEAGTAAVHRAALQDPQFTQTALTRAFSGRTARGLANRFMAEHPHAPAAYPLVNQVTKGLRAQAAASGNPHGTSLWAGTGYHSALPEPAAAIVARLGAR
ncbi:nitronate monooxygenase family protein [Arthrobacter sp. zg-Y1110]|uniref:NAD(P)H-dependent flavin oxidoreductase n=1 Tax=Arthrobacter sp. zg-Y1110 TaxID=2886932 RepID=UPI001D1352FC|nr:nitronate monooxygenase [Arthrobacter sp. zg-Y1110]MCC3291318.1 nitronate monooxygenase [Arthrobacter sp. zg-Y1110]UWX83741.1 nitronate monooxygenase [Arthrobacter sp. zg-Y1110]